MDGMHGGETMNGTTSSMMPPERKKMMMHMTFYWSDQAEVLFSGWPGTRPGMYLLALIFVFALAVVVEWLSHSSFLNRSISSDRVQVGLAQTALYGVRTALGYMVMLSLMSFNAGVFLAAVAGHMIGFFFFGSRVFNGYDFNAVNAPPGKTTDLPPMTC